MKRFRNSWLINAALVIFLPLLAINQHARAEDPPPVPIYSVNASPSYSWAGGTPLHYGINLVNGVNISDSVSLPPATGSGQQVDVHLHSDYFVLVWVQPTDEINQFGDGIAYAVYPRQRLRFIDVKPGLWDFTTNLPMFYPILNNIAALPGGGQADATYLAMGTNVIRQANNHGDSLRMPIALGSTSPIIVYNDTPVRLTVFPDYGQKFNQQANDTPYSLPPGKLALFHDIGPGPDQWIGGLIDSGYTLQFQSRGDVFSPDSTTAYYFGQGLEASIYPQIQRMRVPRSGRITSITTSFINQGPGTSEPSSLYLRKNNDEDTLLSATVTNSEIFHEVVADRVAIEVDAGDYVELKWLTPSWSTSPTHVTINGILYIE